MSKETTIITFRLTKEENIEFNQLLEQNANSKSKLLRKFVREYINANREHLSQIK